MVYRIGDGTSILTNAGNYAFLDELTTNGTLVQSIVNLPQNGFIDTPMAAPISPSRTAGRRRVKGRIYLSG